MILIQNTTIREVSTSLFYYKELMLIEIFLREIDF